MNLSELNFIKNKRVAIVGSSGILLNTEFGQEIDDHDVVVRFNVAKTDGYEKHVGSRTDIRVMNGHTWAGTTSKDIFPEFDDKFTSKLRDTTLIIKGDYNDNQKKLGHQNTHPSNAIIIIDVPFLLSCARAVKSKSIPTCGIITIILLSELTDKLDCYGFNFYRDNWCDKHYWEKINEYDQGKHHDISTEITFLSKLNDDKIINLRY